MPGERERRNRIPNVWEVVFNSLQNYSVAVERRMESGLAQYRSKLPPFSNSNFSTTLAMV